MICRLHAAAVCRRLQLHCGGERRARTRRLRLHCCGGGRVVVAECEAVGWIGELRDEALRQDGARRCRKRRWPMQTPAIAACRRRGGGYAVGVTDGERMMPLVYRRRHARRAERISKLLERWLRRDGRLGRRWRAIGKALKRDEHKRLTDGTNRGAFFVLQTTAPICNCASSASDC